MTYANGVHSNIGNYVAHCLKDADHHFNYKKGVMPDSTLLPNWKEVDHKLVAVCLGALPERVQEDCYRSGKSDTFTRVIFNIFCLVNPGGEKEIEALMVYCRSPPSLHDAAGVRRILEDWVIARNRLKQLSCMEMIPKEKFDALNKIVEKLCGRNSRFKMMWDCKSVVSGPGFHDHTSDDFAQQTEDWLRHELTALESNELLETNQQREHQKWDHWNNPNPRINKMAGEEGGQQGWQQGGPPGKGGKKGGQQGGLGKGGQREGLGKGGQQEEDGRRRFACFNMQNKGACTRQNCPYSHDPETWLEYDPSKSRRNNRPGGQEREQNEATDDGGIAQKMEAMEIG